MLAFEDLITEFGQQIGQTLTIDENRSCALRINDTFEVQIHHDVSHDRVMIASFLYEIPAGKVREECLKEALKANHPFPRIGTLSFLAATSTLVLHHFLPLTGLNGTKLSGVLVDFLDKALLWRNALASGKTAPASTTPGISGSIFDLPSKDKKEQ